VATVKISTDPISVPTAIDSPVGLHATDTAEVLVARACCVPFVEHDSTVFACVSTANFSSPELSFVSGDHEISSTTML
jgi:hypothetical protein